MIGGQVGELEMSGTFVRFVFHHEGREGTRSKRMMNVEQKIIESDNSSSE